MSYFTAEFAQAYLYITFISCILLSILVSVLTVLVIIVFRAYLADRKKNKFQCDVTNVSNITEKEIQVLSEYNKLDEQGKDLIENTIKTLTLKTNNK